MALSDNIIIMKKGVVDQVGDPQTVYYHPADEFVADFIGESNFLHATIADKLDSETALCRFEGHEFEVSVLTWTRVRNAALFFVQSLHALLTREHLPVR